MPSSAIVVLSLSLLALFPAQTKQAAQLADNAKRAGIGVEAGGDACQYLTPEQCCGQMLEIAGFAAHGDQMPRLVKTTVKLTCEDESKVVRDQVCRSILMTRGFSAEEVKGACKPARVKRDCKKNDACDQCTRDLAKLSYRGAHNACRAVTYKPDTSTKVVRVGDSSEADGDTRFRVTKTRTLR